MEIRKRLGMALEAMKMTRKGMIDVKGGVMLVLGLVMIALVGSIGATILASQQATQTENGTAYNISGYGLTAITNFANQLGTVGLVAGLGLILLVLFGAVYFLFGRTEGR